MLTNINKKTKWLICKSCYHNNENSTIHLPLISKQYIFIPYIFIITWSILSSVVWTSFSFPVKFYIFNLEACWFILRVHNFVRFSYLLLKCHHFPYFYAIWTCYSNWTMKNKVVILEVCEVGGGRRQTWKCSNSLKRKQSIMAFNKR